MFVEALSAGRQAGRQAGRRAGRAGRQAGAAVSSFLSRHSIKIKKDEREGRRGIVISEKFHICIGRGQGSYSGTSIGRRIATQKQQDPGLVYPQSPDTGSFIVLFVEL